MTLEWAWPVGVIVILALAVASAIGIGHVVLSPLRKAARRAPQRMQFYISDFAWLLIQLQASLGLVAAYIERNPPWAFYTVLGFLAFALTAMWWLALWSLSRAGVKSVLRRAVLILVLLPAVEASMVLAMAFWVAALAIGYQELRRTMAGEGESLEMLLATGALGVAAYIAAAVLVSWLLRMLTLWLVAERSDDRQITQAL